MLRKIIQVSGQSFWVPRSVRTINPTTQNTYQTLFIAKSRVFLNFYDFWGTKIKSFQFALAFWASATDLGASPRLSPEKTPKIISYTTNYYKQLCNQLIFAINHLFQFIPQATGHPPGWLRFLRYKERIVPVRASALIPPRQLRARPTLSPEVFPENVIK